MAQSINLLPCPRSLILLDDVHILHADRQIHLTDAGQPAMLMIGKLIQYEIEKAGVHLDITASSSNPDDDIALRLSLSPETVTHPEGYRIRISPDRITIDCHDTAGAWYAAMTLRQIARQCIDMVQMPCLEIDDWPDFRHRGVMLDISRDKIPSMETLFSMVDRLTELKFNQLQLYTEHTFAYRRHPDIWRDASPMTGQQVLELDAYCAERFIELVPNQNSFGHMERWLQHKAYTSLAEIPEQSGNPMNPRHWCKQDYRPAGTLCPLDPGSLNLVRGMIQDLLPHFRSNLLNVGCDETFELGEGKSKTAADRKGVGRVYLEFLKEIYGLVRSHDHTMMFWGDIILKHPELIAELPLENMVALDWGYEADSPFDTTTSCFSDAGIPYYVCPGTSSWNSLTGRWDNCRKNLISAARSGIANGASGFLVTDWGDHGHWQTLPFSWPGMAFGAAMAWAGQANENLDMDHALDVHIFHDEAGVTGSIILGLADAYLDAGINIPNQSWIWRILYEAGRPMETGKIRDLDETRLEKTLARIDELMSRLPGSKMGCADSIQVENEIMFGSALLKHACYLGRSRIRSGCTAHTAAELPEDDRTWLAGNMTRLIEDHKRVWLARNRPGGLADSAARLESVLDVYLHHS
jgi:hexosaminidase